MTVRLVTFDAFNTLFRLKKPVGTLYAQHLRQLGHAVPSDAAVTRSFGAAYKRAALSAPHFGHATAGGYRAWWTRVITDTLATTGLPNPDTATVESLINLFATKDPYEVEKSAIPLIAHLKHRGCTVGVLSDSDDRTIKIMAELGFKNLVDFYCLSHQIGASKPSPLMYEAALRLAAAASRHGERIHSHEACHVGDDIERDYEGARACAWNAILWKNEGTASLEKVVLNELDAIK
ncbi:Haloacid dehalogenase-like hydrolase domain-containing protein 3 [Chytriomyces hyalinus]|nr:Haloacid dehalogenase-like hydrolase domain-containing protein 3 [Chytriomyces hyalinus]